MKSMKSILEKEINANEGILRLKPAWVARDFLPPGKRLGLPEDQYNLGERGGICERWIGSTTKADNKISVPNEGLSLLNIEGEVITLKEAVEIEPALIMGEEYSISHNGLGRLPKIFDYQERLPYHIHQMQKHAKLVGCNSKEEAYYFPEGVPTGKHPETFFGVHPFIVEKNKQELLLRPMIEWKDDSILQFARAFLQLPGDGFHVPAGTLHAPGTALTIELQEDSDVFAMMQADCGGKIISKDLLFKDVRNEDKEKYGEKIILDMIDWNICGDPYFYENRHTPPLEIYNTKEAEEHWIFYNTKKFNGKRLKVNANEKILSREKGVYNILVWKGKGKFGPHEIEAGNFDEDELLITYDAAVKEIEIVNTGGEELIIYKFFGPDINEDVPFLPPYKKF
ncbi:MAG: hypothetical protein C4539_17460 [Ignavibacteriales bacterium]|nr:MAG: hypothetical protein C4539_17460 [Ignavibacteriales bacterium]